MLNQWEKDGTKTIIKSIIFGDVKDIEKKIKVSKDILSAYGYAQVKGLFGEIAAALEFSQKGAKAKITGSEKTDAGQINYDVSFSLNKQNVHKYGIQVKNYKGNTLNNLYETDFHLNKIAEIYKYFGKDLGITFLTLIGNNDILEKDLKLYETNLYNFIDNFLRISAGDMTENAINSDIFIFGNKYLPASYLIYLIYEEVINSTSAFSLENTDTIKTNKVNKAKELGSNLLVLEENLQIFKQTFLYYKGISIKLKGLL